MGLALYEGFRRRPSRPDMPDPRSQITVKNLCPAITLSFEPGIVRGAADEIATGDLEFDRQFLARGPEDLVRALLDVGRRRQLLALLQRPAPVRDVLLENGQMTVVIPRGLSRKRVRGLRRHVLKLAKSFQPPGSVAARLAGALQREPDAIARRLPFDALARHHARHPATGVAAEDRDPEMRLAGAVALGPVGRSLLQALAADEEVGGSIAARAIAALGPHFTASEAVSVLAGTVAAAHRRGVLADQARKDVALA